MIIATRSEEKSLEVCYMINDAGLHDYRMTEISWRYLLIRLYL